MGWFSKNPEIPNAEQYVRLHNEGLAAFDGGDFHRAIDLFIRANKAVDGTPTTKTAEGFLFIGLANMKLHARDQGAQWLSQAEGALLTARTLDLNNPYVIYNLGSCYLQQQRFAEAEECFQDYIRLKPDANGLLKLGYICHKTGRRSEAVRCWERVLTIDPANNEAKQNLEGARRHWG